MKSARWFLWMALGLLMLGASSAWAQEGGTFSLGYYSIGPFGVTPPLFGPRSDNTLRIINPGASNGFLCANIYVFDPHQHMLACCSCPVSKNGMLIISVLNDLLPTFAVRPGTSGVIKVVSSPRSSDSVCSAKATYVPTPELLGWLSHWVGSTTPVTLTEQELEEASLSSGELTSLQQTCLNSTTVLACNCPKSAG